MKKKKNTIHQSIRFVLRAYPMLQNIGSRLVEALVATREPHYGERKLWILGIVIGRAFQNPPRRGLAMGC